MSVLQRPVARALAAVVLLTPLASLAAQRNVPSTYAITNARLVPVSGPAIERGTIVIRDGLIAALGASVSVPADARVIEGTGLTVYPGLFDSFGSIGLPSTGRGGGAPAAGSTPAPAPTRGTGASADSPRGVEPDMHAADQIRIDEDALDGPRSQGITTALTVPSGGVFPGQSALINLSGPSVSAMIVKPGVAQHIQFSSGGGGGGGRGGYPGSIMGVFSVLRQELLDAQNYRDLKVAYERNPRGLQRPTFDQGLEALLPALAKQQPVVMVANTRREIDRALDLAKEFGLRAIIAGGLQAHLVADRLKAENVPVLLSLNFPRRTAAPAPDAEPEATSVLRARVDAPKTAALLAAAGVKFAFQSGGLTNWTDFSNNLRIATAAGLTQDQSIRALTLTPAELFGVSDRLGSLDVGKIANLSIMRDGNRVSHLFIDGRPVTVRPPASPAGTGGDAQGRGGRGGPPSRGTQR